MVRQCHSNTCPVGVCTQDEKLREKFTGTPEKVVNLFTFIATEVREILANLGFKSLNDVIGRTDLLKQISKGSPNLDDLDLNPLFVQADNGNNPRYCEDQEINSVPDILVPTALFVFLIINSLSIFSDLSNKFSTSGQIS